MLRRMADAAIARHTERAKVTGVRIPPSPPVSQLNQQVSIGLVQKPPAKPRRVRAMGIQIRGQSARDEAQTLCVVR
jgi:hypothetical protein